MKFYSVLVFLFFSLMSSQSFAQEIVGFAYAQQLADDKTLQLLYTENHLYQEKTHIVAYENESDGIFANKSLSYAQGYAIPEVDFSNKFCDENYSLRPQASTKLQESALVEIDYANGCDDKRLKKTVSLSQPYVIDAGFDFFIRDNLDLIANEKQVFSYALPSRADSVQLMAMTHSCEDLTELFSELLERLPDSTSQKDEWSQCVKVRPKSWLISKFFPAIYLAYAEDKSLKLFAGRSNIGDKEGEHEDVFIVYQNLAKDNSTDNVSNHSL